MSEVKQNYLNTLCENAVHGFGECKEVKDLKGKWLDRDKIACERLSELRAKDSALFSCVKAIEEVDNDVVFGFSYTGNLKKGQVQLGRKTEYPSTFTISVETYRKLEIALKKPHPQTKTTETKIYFLDNCDICSIFVKSK